MLALYEDREMHSRMSDAARDRIRNDFRVETTAEKTIALYRDLMDES
jgi:glycosyltransferase involved in cell wall biosynthesis